MAPAMTTSAEVAVALTNTSSAPMMMDDGNMSNMTISPMEPMAMTFFSSQNTSLFSQAWTPSTTASYIATCIFLLLLGAVMRGMLAIKPVIENAIWKLQSKKHEMLLSEEDCSEGIDYMKHHGHIRDGDVAIGGLYGILQGMVKRWRPWRFKPSVSRALYETLLSITGYLLMLAVMTMNIGYFFSVIAGVFLGTFVLGNLATNSALYEENHC
ncbi:Ctr copper transporter family-domain-containing protein [Truncatella angustata]|uniref:Copper transport protein n=1 Tax=Truncatella angustata TaxID=152316 RepID=A0A9P8RIC8_9PEZI|nr:Ctr copper transporter family-domain-containing protein [Truncatella angustata]KAH6646583.1 Ctr copper transporter family-domain-containing protein [Truncatella angustata]